MKTVNIGELRNQLSAYLQLVRNGEEVVIKDRNVPVARILPIRPASISEEEARLVAEGKMTLPEKEMDWEAFWAIKTRPRVSAEALADAIAWSKGDR
jgi:prevent-host-death family protein